MQKRDSGAGPRIGPNGLGESPHDNVVHSGAINVLHVPTLEQPADILTKALGKNKVADARLLLGLRV